MLSHALVWTFRAPIQIPTGPAPLGDNLRATTVGGVLSPSGLTQWNKYSLVATYAATPIVASAWYCDFPVTGLSPPVLDGQTGLIELL